MVIIIIVIIHLYAGYLQLCAWNKPRIAGYPIQCCSNPVTTIYRHALTFPMLNALYLYISTVCSSVQCTIWRLLSGSSLISCFPGTLLRYCLSACQMVPVASNINGITSVFTFHMRCIASVMSLHFRIFSLLSWSHFCPLKLTCTFLLQ